MYIIVVAILSIFFLYLLMFSGGISSILPCRVQHFILNNLVFKHIIIFSTIFFFTYVLDWYTPKTVLKYNYFEEEKNIWTFYKESIIIYFIFLISSCLNTKYLMISFLIMFIFINISIYRNYKYKNDNNKLSSILQYSNNENIFIELKNKFNLKKIKNNFTILNKKYNKKYNNLYLLLLIENILKIIYVFVLIIGLIVNLLIKKKNIKINLI